MKNIFYILITIIIFAGCKEEPVEYTLMSGVMSERKVLIEEFTGVNCVNCPLGSVELDNLLATFGDNLIAVSIHSGFFAMPHPDNDFDFRTADGEAITTLVDAPNTWPSAVVDRKLFDGETDRQTSLENWTGFISSQLAIAPMLEVENHITFDAVTRNMELNVDLTSINIELPTALKITVLITESNIVDRQLTPPPVGVVEDYVHKHVLRDVITGAEGDIINPLVTDELTTMTFNYTVPANYVAENCEIVVFVTNNDGTNIEVLQADADHLVE